MRIIETCEALRAWADAERAAGRRVALVPTMGALHEGHLSLVAEAQNRADAVVVSVFVNPTQFNESSDFDGYPRTLESDARACEEAGVDVVFAPAVAELYPDGAVTWVEVEGLTEPLCGAARPGHFRGVTTIVSKLLLAAKPHVAVFGQKDFQQLAVIRRMERDLGFGVEIVGGATVREPDGLALSSRNVRLGPEARRQSLCLVAGLDAAEQAVAGGERSRDRLLAGVRAAIEKSPLATLDYAELRDPESLAMAPETLCQPALLALAVHFAPDPDADSDAQGAEVRLIDNRVLTIEPRKEDGR